jgi:hypothetical protein
MGIVEWMTAVLLVRPVAVEIGRLAVLGRSAWSEIRPGRDDRAAGGGHRRLKTKRDHDRFRSVGYRHRQLDRPSAAGCSTRPRYRSSARLGSG